MTNEAEILVYMDADLSTDLGWVPKLIEPLTFGVADIAIGSRLLPESVTKRCWKREITSRAYNFLVQRVLGTRISDMQCGFKAITRKAARELLPLVQDDGWFFDTELLILAQRRGYRIAEIPVRWREGEQSSVRMFRTMVEDLRGMWRMRRS